MLLIRHPLPFTTTESDDEQASCSSAEKDLGLYQQLFDSQTLIIYIFIFKSGGVIWSQGMDLKSYIAGLVRYTFSISINF